MFLILLLKAFKQVQYTNTNLNSENESFIRLHIQPKHTACLQLLIITAMYKICSSEQDGHQKGINELFRESLTLTLFHKLSYWPYYLRLT